MIVKCPRPETRCDCGARMKINCRQAKKYRVVQFVAQHNHELSTPSKTHLFRFYRHMTMAHEAEIDMARSCEIAPKESIELMSKQVGGRENLGFIRDDLKNYLRSKRSKPMMQGDTGGVLEYLQRMQLEDPNFYYAIQVDEDDLITKTGNVCVSSESSQEMGSKAKLSFRYKELSYLYMQLMTKASECDEAYQIAKDGFWKMSEQMDACCQGKKKMKEVRIEENCSAYQDVDTNPSEVAYNKIKGIKVKEKVTYKSSKRPRSALEMATKKRKYKVKEKSSSKRLQVRQFIEFM